jgi:hypothetical protein
VLNEIRFAWAFSLSKTRLWAYTHPLKKGTHSLPERFRLGPEGAASVLAGHPATGRGATISASVPFKRHGAFNTHEAN